MNEKLLKLVHKQYFNSLFILSNFVFNRCYSVLMVALDLFAVSMEPKMLIAVTTEEQVCECLFNVMEFINYVVPNYL